MRFRNALLVGTLAAALLPALAFSVWQYDDVQERIASEDARQMQLAAEAASVVAETVERARRAVLVAAYSASIPLSEAPTPALVRMLGETLRRIALSQPVIENLHVDDAHLKSLLFWPSTNEAGDSNLNQNHADRWHAAALQAKPGAALISPVFRAKGAFEGFTVNIAAAIPNAGDASAPPAGIVSTALRLEELGRAMAKRLLGTDLHAALFDETGRLIYPLEGASEAEAAALGSMLKERSSEDDEGIIILKPDSAREAEESDIAKDAVLKPLAVVVARLRNDAPDWTVAIYRDADQRVAEMTVLKHRALAWAALLFILTAFLSVLMSSAMSRAVEKLSRFLSSNSTVPDESERIRFPQELADFQLAYVKTKIERDRSAAALRSLNERLHAEVQARTAELQKRRATLEALFDGMAEGVVLLANGRIDAMNREAARFFPALKLGDPAEVLCAALGIKALPKVDRLEVVRHAGAARELLRFSVSASGISLEGLLIRDVTAREDVAQMKENLLGMAAHELKTPVQTLSLAIEMLGKTQSPQKSAAILTDLTDSVRHLRTLVHDWLDVARIEGGVFSVVRKPVQLPLIVRRAVRLVRTQYPCQRVEVCFEEAAECLMGDGDRLLQLFSNLLTNAARYRKHEAESCVRIEGVRRGSVIEVAVDDNGIGIAPANREKVFERFFQVDASNRRRAGGTGQGLVIARAIARAHGGDIRVEPSKRPEGGSRFILTLPAAGTEVG